MSSLILLERDMSFVERARRARKDMMARPAEPRASSLPFYFVMSRVQNLDPAKLKVVNWLFEPSAAPGLLFLVLLADKNLILAARMEDLRREQPRRHLSGEKNAHVYVFTPRISDNKTHQLLVSKIKTFT